MKNVKRETYAFNAVRILVRCTSAFGILTLLLTALTACQPATPEVLEFSGATMGTVYYVTVIPGDEDVSAELESQIQAQLDRVDQLMSTYKPDSQLNQLNGLAAGESMLIAAELAKVLQLSKEIYQQTDGSFEPTVGPLVELWGFGSANTGDRVPASEQVQQALAQLGFDQLQLNGISAGSYSVRKNSAIRLDLSAIAKGYAVDLVSELLTAQGLGNHLVEVGGEMRLSGLKPDGQPWRIGIEQPQPGHGSARTAIAVTDAAVATSGDYRNYFERDGVRYSHTIDPGTGYPVTHKLASVTVITDNCARADAFATAFMVMGEQRTLALAEELQLPVYLLVKQGDGFAIRHSTAFEKYLP